MPIRIVNASNEGSFPVEGMTVGQVALKLRDVFNISDSASALVNGIEVDRNRVLKNDDNLQFIKLDGHKGGIQEYWSENEIAELFGDDAIDEMRDMGFEPSSVPVYTSQQVASWQAARCDKPEPSKHGPVIDPGQFTISYQGQEPAFLGNTMLFRLITRLARRPNVFVSFNNLKREVWKDDHTDDQTVSRTARRLREKLDELGVGGVTLETQPHHVRLKLN